MLSRDRSRLGETGSRPLCFSGTRLVKILINMNMNIEYEFIAFSRAIRSLLTLLNTTNLAEIDPPLLLAVTCDGAIFYVGQESLKAAVHWERPGYALSQSSPNLTLAAMGLRADSARWLSVRAEPLTR